MSPNGGYCKAYTLGELRRFAGWSASGQDTASDARVLYLHDDFRVTSDPFEGEPVAFGGDGPDWRRFCAEELGFAPPAEEAAMVVQAEE